MINSPITEWLLITQSTSSYSLVQVDSNHTSLPTNGNFWKNRFKQSPDFRRYNKWRCKLLWAYRCCGVWDIHCRSHCQCVICPTFSRTLRELLEPNRNRDGQARNGYNLHLRYVEKFEVFEQFQIIREDIFLKCIFNFQMRFVLTHQALISECYQLLQKDVPLWEIWRYLEE